MELNDFSYPPTPDAPGAKAIVRGNEQHPDLCGMVLFYQTPFGVVVNAQFEGLPVMNGADANRFLGFHIHEKGDCSQNEEFDFNMTGNHYNPDNRSHPNHRGDLPPILNCNGISWQSFLTDAFTVMDVIGRSVVVHDMPDDFITQPSGNSGAKIGCGVIKLNN
ncbi:MAG: superoxide dismutase family protein [Lachnospiraceae bacterium]|nr:superoxide dismutase family protein [Lachnospiraceae bacterium]